MLICIFALGGCSNSMDLEDSAKEAGKSAVEELTDQLISMGIVNSGMQADDGKSLVWGDRKEVEIEGTECYALELRYSDDEDINGELAGRLIGSYAVSKDGMEFYQYNPTDDAWEHMLSDETVQ